MNNLDRSIPVERQLRKAIHKRLQQKQTRHALNFSAGPATLQRINHPGRYKFIESRDKQQEKY